jgi:hypothetical protein
VSTRLNLSDELDRLKRVAVELGEDYEATLRVLRAFAPAPESWFAALAIDMTWRLVELKCRRWASATPEELIAVIREHGSLRRASAATGIPRTTLSRMVAHLGQLTPFRRSGNGGPMSPRLVHDVPPGEGGGRASDAARLSPTSVKSRA